MRIGEVSRVLTKTPIEHVFINAIINSLGAFWFANLSEIKAGMNNNIPMAWHKTTVTPSLTLWKYDSLALNHLYIVFCGM